ncbi:MAG: hypothetical protein GWO24_17335, partial [Akkermansiaceae bacterium]|nr:hypothetical protein [Akkermansiaceae bacterium]
MITLGRFATADDLLPDPADQGMENHISFVNLLVAWCNHTRNGNLLENATPEQREALKRDPQPVVAIGPGPNLVQLLLHFHQGDPAYAQIRAGLPG